MVFLKKPCSWRATSSCQSRPLCTGSQYHLNFFLKMWKQEMPSWKISSSVVNRPWTRGLSFLHWEDCGVWREGIESVQCLPVHVSFGGKIIISVLFLLIYIVCWLLLRFFALFQKAKEIRVQIHRILLIFAKYFPWARSLNPWQTGSWNCYTLHTLWRIESNCLEKDTSMIWK